jgi:hypothetical protein
LDSGDYRGGAVVGAFVVIEVIILSIVICVHGPSFGKPVRFAKEGYSRLYSGLMHYPGLWPRD